MARKTAPKVARRSAHVRSDSAQPAPTTDREKIIAAFLALLAEKPFEAIGLADIASNAKVSLVQLRSEFPSTLAIVAAHIKETDRAVLAKDLSDMADEPARERLFDVLMRRLEALAPHREGIRSLLRSARRNPPLALALRARPRRTPPLALALNALTLRSQQWMLTAAGIGASGPRGMIRAQGLAVMFARVLPVFIDDDDPGLARTMAALD